MPAIPRHTATTGAALAGDSRHRAPNLADALNAAVVAGEVLIRTGLLMLARRKGPVLTPVRMAEAAPRVTSVDEPQSDVHAQLGLLVYELLDAHADTADLAGDLRLDERWRAHLDYLRALQRTGREALAHLSTKGPA